MVKFRFIQNNGETLDVETYEGQSLMEAAVAVGVEGIDAVCFGSVVCGTCHVYVERLCAVGEPGETERVILAETGVQKPNSRLACQIRLSQACDGLTFTVAPPRRD